MQIIDTSCSKCSQKYSGQNFGGNSTLPGKQTQLELAEKLKPGADVMTSFGLFATVLDMDDDTNVATLDVGNGVELKVHRQVLTKVVDPEAESAEAGEDASEDAPAADKS